ncbi:unnamed protein product, partial [marine sediment metagenome]
LQGFDVVNRLAEVTGAQIVVSGRFYQQGESLQFHAQITDAIGGTSLRSIDPVSGSPEDPMIPIEALRKRVMGAFALIFDPEIKHIIDPKSQPPTYEAYREFIEGGDLFLRGQWDRSIERFKRAVELDSTFFQPLLVMAVAHLNMGRVPIADSIRQVLEKSLEKLTLFERQQFKWLQAVLKGDCIAQLEEARELAKIIHHFVWVYQVGLHAQRVNKLHEALEAFNKINESDIGNWAQFFGVYTSVLHMLGD